MTGDNNNDDYECNYDVGVNGDDNDYYYCSFYLSIAGHTEVETRDIEIVPGGRKIHAPITCGRVADFTFEQLCVKVIL